MDAETQELVETLTRILTTTALDVAGALLYVDATARNASRGPAVWCSTPTLNASACLDNVWRVALMRWGGPSGGGARHRAGGAGCDRLPRRPLQAQRPGARPDGGASRVGRPDQRLRLGCPERRPEDAHGGSAARPVRALRADRHSGRALGGAVPLVLRSRRGLGDRPQDAQQGRFGEHPRLPRAGHLLDAERGPRVPGIGGCAQSSEGKERP